MKAKSDELWPSYDSPNRIEYSVGPLKRADYEKAREAFTLDNITAAQEALKAQEDFDLVERLRRAVYLYYWTKAGRRGDLDIFGLLPKAQQASQLEDLIKRLLHF